MKESDSVQSPARIAVEIIARIRALSRPNAQSVREVRREFSKRLSKESPDTVLQIAHILLESPTENFRFVAYELIHHHRPSLASLREKDLERLGRGIDSWAAVDMFGCFLAGPAWRENQISDRVIDRWAHSRDRWWRRAALVSTVPLNSKARGGSGDISRTLGMCRLLVSDRDDMVVKAMSWALRELSKRDSKSVRRFLDEYRNVIAARVIREVENKLTTGLKNPRSKVSANRSVELER